MTSGAKAYRAHVSHLYVKNMSPILPKYLTNGDFLPGANTCKQKSGPNPKLVSVHSEAFYPKLGMAKVSASKTPHNFSFPESIPSPSSMILRLKSTPRTSMDETFMGKPQLVRSGFGPTAGIGSQHGLSVRPSICALREADGRTWWLQNALHGYNFHVQRLLLEPVVYCQSIASPQRRSTPKNKYQSNRPNS